MHGDQAELRRVGDGGVKVVHSGEAASQRVNTLVSVCLSTRGPAKIYFRLQQRGNHESREIFVPDLSPAPAGQTTVSASELSYFKRRGGPAGFSPPRSAAISGASKKFVGSFAVVTGDKGIH